MLDLLLFFAFTFLAFIPICSMFYRGWNLPKTRGDRKDLNPVNRYLRMLDAQLRNTYQLRGIFKTEAYSCVAHALMLSGPLLFLHLWGVPVGWPADVTRKLEWLIVVLILACLPYYGWVAVRRYKREAAREKASC